MIGVVHDYIMVNRVKVLSVEAASVLKVYERRLVLSLLVDKHCSQPSSTKTYQHPVGRF